MADSEVVRVANAEVKAGIFLTFCLGLFMLMVLVYGRFSRTWADRTNITVVFTGIPELRAGAPVRYNGMRIGRVIDTRIVRLDDEYLENFPVLGLDDLSNLPLSENERYSLDSRVHRLPPLEADQQIRQALKGRSIIVLTLDVLLESDPKRFRLDDKISVSTTLMGDSWVEITSGIGKEVPQDYSKVMIGLTMDVVTDLTKSLDNIGDILRAAGATLGGKEESGIKAKIQRLETFTTELETETGNWHGRLDNYWNQADALLDEKGEWADKELKRMVAWAPDFQKSLKGVQLSTKKFREDMGEKLDSANGKMKTLRSNFGKKLIDWEDRSKGWLETLPPRMREWRRMSEDFPYYAEKLDSALLDVRAGLVDNVRDGKQQVHNMAVKLEGLSSTLWTLANQPWTVREKPHGLAGRSFFVLQMMGLADYYWRKRGLGPQIRQVVPTLQGKNPADRERLVRVKQILNELEKSEAAYQPYRKLMDKTTGRTVEKEKK